MDITKVRPREGYIVVSQVVETRKTESGLELEENDDDFIAHATVVHGNGAYKAGAEVIFSVLENLAFFDSTNPGMQFAFIKEDTVIGTYGGE